MNKTTLANYILELKLKQHNAVIQNVYLHICTNITIFQYYKKLFVIPAQKVRNSDLPKPKNKRIEQNN